MDPYWDPVAERWSEVIDDVGDDESIPLDDLEAREYDWEGAHQDLRGGRSTVEDWQFARSAL